MRIDWPSLKKFIDDTELFAFVNYVELPVNFYVWLYYEGESFSTMLDKGTVECQDFTNNYKPRAILKNDLSDGGIKMAKTIFVGQDMMLHALFVAYTTSIAQTNDTTGFVSIRLRDENLNIIQDGSNAHYTEIDFCPGQSLAYGLYGGGLSTLEPIETDFVGDCIMAPDVPVQSGGQLYFVKNMLLAKPTDKAFINAINVGEIPGIPGVNVVRIRLKHDKGIQKRFQAQIQYYI